MILELGGGPEREEGRSRDTVGGGVAEGNVSIVERWDPVGVNAELEDGLVESGISSHASSLDAKIAGISLCRIQRIYSSHGSTHIFLKVKFKVKGPHLNLYLDTARTNSRTCANALRQRSPVVASEALDEKL